MDYQTLTPRGVRWIKKNWDNFDFDMSIQRRGGLWNVKKKTMLIHTAIAGYPCNPIFLIDEGNNGLQFIDGKQRMNTMYEFVEDKFALTDDILEAPESENITLDDLVGKKFSELEQDYQDAILDFRFQYISIKNATEEEIEETMFRLNQGELMNAMELLRVRVGQKVRDFLDEITSHDFFANAVSFSAKDRLRFGDQQTVLQCLSLVANADIGFSSSEINGFIMPYKESGITDDVKRLMETISDYLYDAFRGDIDEKKEYVSVLKKIHIPMIFSIADKYMDKIDAGTFGTIILSFINEQAELRKTHKNNPLISKGRYNIACDAGVNKRENVDIRLDEMMLYVDRKVDRFLQGDNVLNFASGQD